MSSAKTLRRVRVLQIAAIIINIAVLALDLVRGSFLTARLPIAFIIALTVAVRVHSGTIKRREWLDRPRPDYAAIARMEREVYGEAFKHEGAPARTASRPEPRWDGRTTHPDTTEPATLSQYFAWLQGYIKRGGKPTHFYDYPFGQAGFRYAGSKLTIDSDYEYGSSLRHIVVAKNVRTERTNPAGSFGGWAHTSCFFMHGYRTNKSTVPVYSDPEFDEFRARSVSREADTRKTG